MPNRFNLLYRTNKIRTKHIPQINFDIFYEEEKEEVISEEEIIEEIVITNLDVLMEELKKIRSNAKRKLEIWIRQNRELINDMSNDDKGELMNFIDCKYFNK